MSIKIINGGQSGKLPIASIGPATGISLSVVDPIIASANTDAYCKNAYPGMHWEYRIGVEGGRWPYIYKLMNSTFTAEGTEGVDYPTGMTIGRNITKIGDHYVTPSDYSVVKWPNPTGTTETFYVQIEDQVGATVNITWPLTIGTTGWTFVDIVNGNDTTGTGTFANPIKTFVTGLYVNDTDNSWVGTRAVFRAGSYPIHNGTSGVNADIDDLYKPRVYIAYHDGNDWESVTFDQTTGHFTVDCDDFYIAHIISDGNKTANDPKSLAFQTTDQSRLTIDDITWRNKDTGQDTVIANESCIHSTDTQNVSLRKRYLHVCRNTMESTARTAFFVIYTTEHFLCEQNYASSINHEHVNIAGHFIHMDVKVENQYSTYRNNKALNMINCEQLGVFGNGGTGNSFQEMSWNVMEASDPGATVLLGQGIKWNTGTDTTATNQHMFKNTIVLRDSVRGRAAWFLINASRIQVEDNVLVAVDAIYQDANDGISWDDNGDNAFLATDDIDANNDLINGGTNDPARDTYLSVSGYELA